MKHKHTIFGVHITDRLKKAVEVQKVFGKYGCNIKTRLGMHEVSDQACATNGLVILEVVGDDKTLKEFEKALSAIEGIAVKKMVFTHP